MAFIGANGDVVGVAIANADGSESRVVVPGLVDGKLSVLRAMWSADDTILYLATRGTAGDTLPVWQVNVDGTGLQPVPGLPTAISQLSPQVLADGRLSYYDGAGHVIAFDPKTKTSTIAASNFYTVGSVALSPDGKRIASVEVVDQKNTEQIVVYNADGSNRQVITTLPMPIGFGTIPMAWSPDSAELAFYGSSVYTVRDMTGSGRADISIAPPADSPVGTYISEATWIALTGSQPGTPPSPTNSPTTPPTSPPTTPPAPGPGGTTHQTSIHRIGGENRYDTGRMVSQNQWPSGTATAVVLARGDQAPDALAGVPLAARVHGPLLLTAPTVLDTATRAEIDRVLGGPQSHKTIYILGGKNAVSPGIEDSLRNAGYLVVRYGGDTRYDTALRIASAFGHTDHVIVATGRNFPDALSAGPLGAAENAPVVLSDDTTLDPATAAFITGHQTIDPVGGQAQKATATLNLAGKTVTAGLAGSDRYSTGSAVASQIAHVLGHTPATVGIASGTTFPDALTGGAFTANASGALLLTDSTTLSGPTATLLGNWHFQTDTLEVFGGTSAVGSQPFETIRKVVNGIVR